MVVGIAYSSMTFFRSSYMLAIADLVTEELDAF